MMRKLPFLLVLGLLWVPFVQAVSVSGLYEARVPVADKSDGARRQATSKAMWQVLVKVTGDRAVVNDERAKPLVSQAEKYMQQYRYLEPESAADGLKLWVGFDGAAVADALRQQGIASWSQERPATLVWLAVSGSDGDELIGMGKSPGSENYLQPIIDQARERGIPLLLPLMDLEDTRKLQASDVQGGAVDRIRAASERYPTDTVLAVSVDGSDAGSLQARWTLISTALGNDSWSSEGKSLDEVLSTGINRLANNLAQHYAPAPSTTIAGDSTRIPLTVTAVNSLEDYARAQSYLEGLNGVSRVDARVLRPDSVVFEVETLAGAAALDQAIGLGNTLRAEALNVQEGPGEGDTGRSYRLQH